MNSPAPYGIPESDINLLLSILAYNRNIVEVILFGSRAKGSWENGSDIDLALKGKALTVKDIIEASMQIEELDIPNKVDLVLYDRISEPALVEHINRVGILLYKKEMQNT